MKRRFSKWLAILIMVLIAFNIYACAENAIGTTVVMRVSHMTQNAVVDAGEDLSIEVNIDGVNPDSYQWFFQDNVIAGADQNVLNIVDAQPDDTGIYRLDAYDADGELLVSMDIAARVVEDVVPQSGDFSMPVGFAFAGIALCALAMAVLLRRRATA